MSVKPPKSPAEWGVGSVVMGLYEVRQVFESGGMGLVYRIHHRGWDVDLAMKSPRPEFFRTESQKRAFENEAETWMNLGLHPNTVSCFYVRRIEGIPRVFAEYIDGGNLREWIKGRKLLSLESILDAAIQFACGIGYAHDQGLIHQDIKPANVMMTPEGIAKVTDFGLAKARMMSGEESLVTPGTTSAQDSTDGGETIKQGTTRSDKSGQAGQADRAGQADQFDQADQADQAGPATLMNSVLVSCGGMTPAYCSPEQAAHSPLSRKTDIWSWGLSVLEMFVGDVTWMSGQTAQLTLKNYLKNGPLDKRIPPMPEPLVELLRRCFERDPDNRPAEMGAITATLKDIYRETLLHEYPRQEYRAGRDTADSLNNRAISYVDLGRNKDVDALWRQALKSDPHHLESTFNLILHEWKKGAIDEDAVFVRMEGIRAAHASRRYHHLLGKLHMFLGGYARAVENFKKALDGTKMEAEETKDLVLALCAEGIKTEGLASVENSVRMTLWREVEKLCAFIGAGGGAATASKGGAATASKGGAAASSKDGAAASPKDGLAAASKDGLAASPDSGAPINAGGGAATAAICGTPIDAGYMDVQTAAALALALKRMGRQQEALLALHAPPGIPPGSPVNGGAKADPLFTGGLTGVAVTGEPGGDAVEAAASRRLPGYERSFVFNGHTERMRATAFTPDGRYVLSGGEEAALYLWDMNTGEIARTLTGHTGFINSVAISQDGLFALSGGDDLTVRRWDLASGKCTAVYRGHTFDITCVSASSNGLYILSASNDATLRLWSVKNEQCLRVLKGHTAGVTTAALARDAYFALSSGNDRALILWNIITGKNLRTYKGFSGGVTSVAFSPDGRRFVCGMDDGSTALWLVDSETPYAVYKTHDGAVVTAAFSPDGMRLYSSGVDGTLRIRDVGGPMVYVFKGVETGSFALSADGQRAAFAAWNGIGALEISNTYWLPCAVSVPVSSSEAQEREGDFSRRIESAQRLIDEGVEKFSTPQLAQALALVEEARTIKGYERDAQALAAIQRLALIMPKKELSSAWTIKVFKAVGGATPVVSGGATDSRSGRATPGIGGSRTPDVGIRASMECASVSDDKKIVVSGDADGFVTFRDVAAAKPPITVKGHEGIVHCAIFQRGALTAVTGGADETLRVWNVADGRLMATLEGHAGAVTRIALSGDGRFAVSGSADETLRLWDFQTGQCIGVFEGHRAAITAAALSPSGALMFSAAEEENLRLWDTFSGRCKIVLKTPNNVTTAAALSHDMRLALSAGLYDHSITLWDIESRKPLRVFKGHTGRITSVSFTPDGRFVLSAAHDATLRLWDVENAQTPAIFKGHNAPVTSVSLCDDSFLAVSSSRDGTLRLWHLDWRLNSADFTQWDKGAAHCLNVFLDLHVPYIQDAMTRRGTPQWNREEFNALLTELSLRGLGRIKPDGVLKKLHLTAASMEETRQKDEASFNKTVLSAADLIKARDYSGAYSEMERASSTAGYARDPRVLDLSEKLLGVFPRKGIFQAWKLRTFKGHAGAVTCAAAIQNCKYVLTGGEDGALNLWETDSWKNIRTFKGHTGAVTCAAVGPMERYAVTGGADASVRLWDLLTGKGLAVYKIHAQAVSAVAMTRDKRFILSGANDAGICLTEISTGEPVYFFRGHTAGVTDLCLTPDSDTLIVSHSDGVVHVRDTATGALIKILRGHKQPVTCIRTTADGRFALSSSRDRTLRVWDIGRASSDSPGPSFTGGLKGVADAGGLSGGVDAGGLSGGADLATTEAGIAGADTGGGIGKAGETGGKSRQVVADRVLDFRSGCVGSFAPSPDGRFIIAGDEYGRIFVVEAGGAAALEFRAHKGRINAVAVGQDGRIALSAGDDGTVCLWRLHWQPDVRPVSADGWAEGALAYVERFVARNSQRPTQVADGGPSQSEFSENDLLSLMDDLSRGGYGWLGPDAVHKKAVELALLYAGRIKAGRERVRQALATFDEAVDSGDYKNALAAAVSACGVKGFERSEETLAVMGRLNLLLPKKNPVSSWKTVSLRGHTEGVSALAASPDGRYLVSAAAAAQDRTARLWDLKTGRCLHTITAHAEGVSAVAVSADGRHVFSAGKDKIIRVTDAASGRSVTALEGHAGGVLSLAASLDGRYLVSGGGDRTLRLWDTSHLSASTSASLENAAPPAAPQLTQAVAQGAEQGGALPLTQGGAGAASRSGAPGLTPIDAGGRTATAARSGAAADAEISSPLTQGVASPLTQGGAPPTMQGIAPPKCLKVVEAHTGSVTSAAFTPDGWYVVSSGRDGSVCVWDVPSMQSVLVLKDHSGSVTCTSVSPDMRYLASGGEDRTVRVYDALRGECVHVLKGHAGAVTSLDFSPDSRHLLSASEDRTMRLWECLTGRHELTVEGHAAKIRSALFVADGGTIVSSGDEKNILTWHIQWELEGRTAGGWSDSAAPYLDTCIIKLMPSAKSVLTLQTKPRVENSDVARLASELALRGLGWLGRDALAQHLGETASQWKEVLQRRKSWYSKLAGKV